MEKFKMIMCCFLVVLAVSLSGCSGVRENSRRYDTIGAKRGFSGAVAPDRVWESEYYVYKNGKYRFIKGHYRKVRAKEAFWKRSLQGLTTKSDYPVAY
jgi:hypothetical protein